MKASEYKERVSLLESQKFLAEFALECLLLPSDDKRYAIVKTTSKNILAYLIGPGRADGGVLLIVFKESRRAQLDYFDNAYQYWVNYSGSDPEVYEIRSILGKFLTVRNRT